MADKFKRLLSAFIAFVVSLTAINIMVMPTVAETVGDIIMAGDINVENDTSYPWINTDYNGITVVQSGNSGIGSSSSTMTFSISGMGVMSFGCYTSTEKNYDKLVVSLDGTAVHTLSGVTEWQKLNVAVDADGSHTIIITYTKDSSVNSNDDTCYVGDVSFCKYADESDFTFDSSTGTITKYNGSGEAIVVPSSIGGIDVKNIGYYSGVTYTDGVFYCANITSVIISEGIESIGTNAFSYCTKLKTITLPNSIKKMASRTFGHCKLMKSATIPPLAEQIYTDTFYPCDSLKAIIVSNDNAYYASVDGVLFNKDITTILKYPQGRQGSYTIPDTVNTIKSSTFSNSYKLTEIIIPSSVVTIGSNAFFQCSGLTYIDIPNGVEKVESLAFQSCHNVKSISIPQSVKSIYGNTFYGCSSLTNISVDANNEKYTSVNGVLYNKDITKIISYPNGLTGDYIIPDSVTEIGSSAFMSCRNLTSIVIPNSVTSIGSSAFKYCIGLTNVTIPSSVMTISYWCFSDCTSLESIMIPSSVTSIGSDILGDVNNAVIYCEKGSTADNSSLYPDTSTIKYITAESDFIFDSSTGTITKYTGSSTEVVIPSTIDGVAVKYIGSDSIGSSSDGVFASSNISSVIIPDCVESIGKSTFYSCKNLTSITIPDNIKSINSRTFCNCESLTNITLPENLISIGNSAFSGCNSLTNISIPVNVTSIGDYAFSSCSNLTYINIENVLDMGYKAFIN
ncbi:MAG: leucine-rich repeat domain-containing protein, partial [Hominilimicola sp.]